MRATPFSSLLQAQRTCRVLLLVAAAQLALVGAGLPAWSCPILAATGVPCPGCGLTHACLQLVQGEWRAALVAQPVAPALLFALALLALAAFLPARHHKRLVVIVTDVERITRATWVVLGLLFAGWFLRLG